MTTASSAMNVLLRRLHRVLPGLGGDASRRQAVLVVGAIAALVLVGASVFVLRLDAQIAEEARGRLHAYVEREAADIDDLFHAASSDLRLASQNSVFEADIRGTARAVPPGDRAAIEAAIRYTGERYAVDEICIIRGDGAEIARYNGGQVAPVNTLSPDESYNNPAFLPAMSLPDDAVYITDPYVSPDSQRWVYGFATPIFVNGQRQGILHFELPVEGIAQHLTARNFAARGYNFLMQRDGTLLSHPDLAAFRAAAGVADDPATAPFPGATAPGRDAWNALVPVMLAEPSGEASFEQDGNTYQVVYRPVHGGADIVGSVVPQDLLFADLGRARTDLLVTLGPLVALMLALSAWFARRLQATNRRLEASARASGQLAAIVVAADDAILRTDLQGQIVTWNTGAEQMYGYTQEEAIGHPLSDYLASGRRDELAHVFRSVAGGDAAVNHESVHMAKNLEAIDVAVTISPIRDAHGEVTACSVVIRDIRQRKRLEEELTHQALHDALTGLPNRALFLDRLGHALDATRRDGGGSDPAQHAVLFLDVDDFKVVNDSLGHRIGDELLRQIADRLTRVIRPGDTASRLGGDEFTFLLENVADLESAEATAKRIIANFDDPFNLQGHRVVVSVSIGIALSGDASDGGEILRKADLAMYDAKGKGKARYAVYNHGMNKRAWVRLQLEGELRAAISEGQLEVHYQPIFDLVSGTPHIVEALVRWRHPERGWIPPAEFIPLAEQTGLIVQIGEFVLTTACHQLKAWELTRTGPPLLMSVNASPRQLQAAGFTTTFQAILREAGIDPGRLQLEITEGLLQDDGTCLKAVTELRELGTHVALDDFGTGYSSLASIRQLPIDALKIDRSLVSEFIGEGPHSAIVTAAVAFAKALGLQLTAEGIESEEQALALRELGCRFGQGFYLSRPQSSDEMTALLQRLAAVEPKATRRSAGKASRPVPST